MGGAAELLFLLLMPDAKEKQTTTWRGRGGGVKAQGLERLSLAASLQHPLRLEFRSIWKTNGNLRA